MMNEVQKRNAEWKKADIKGKLYVSIKWKIMEAGSILGVAYS
jgi:hypothetical protein